MRYLLDTHELLWFVRDDPQLPNAHAAAIESDENTIVISVVSIWEITMKVQAGRLDLPLPPVEFVRQARAINGFGLIGLDEEDVTFVATLPMIHKEPYDRTLIAQAPRHNLTLITKDRKILRYNVPTLAF